MRTNRLLVQAQNLLISRFAYRKLQCTTPAGDCFAFPNPSVRGDHSINAAQLPGFAALGVRGENDDFSTETPYRNMLHFSPYEHWSAVFVFFTIRYGRPLGSVCLFSPKSVVDGAHSLCEKMGRRKILCLSFVATTLVKSLLFCYSFFSSLPRRQNFDSCCQTLLSKV